MRWTTDNTFAAELPEFFVETAPVPVAHPSLVVLNEPLARRLGLDPAELASPAGVEVLAGNAIAEGARPLAQAYAGHQFGGFNPGLGDGRAHLLAEVIDVDGNRVDIALKGSGRTRFSRGGDGRAGVGPMLREYVVSEAMAALGVPTTRSLAVVRTGETVLRQPPQPGAVLTRVASSHLRVGTFELFRQAGDAELLWRLIDYVRRRHYPEVAERDIEALLAAIVQRQAELIAAWMSVGFIHGVMNTDNMALSGETIDYGPCAFMEGFDPNAVFSSIDHQGRYRYANQPSIARWNLTRLAEMLLMTIEAPDAEQIDRIQGVLAEFDRRYELAWLRRFRAKLGLDGVDDDERSELDQGLINELLSLMATERLDFTATFRQLAESLRSEPDASGTGASDPLLDVVVDRERYRSWRAGWLRRLGERAEDAELSEIAAAMDRTNPLYVPRNHLVEAVLEAGVGGDLAPLHALLDALRHPFTERDGLDAFAAPAPREFTDTYVTYCGT
ncbi:MAG: YdiU family protein [Actinobacteria bacterium]|nr:YdiU family protein [Actinomycetota bacterium]